MFTLRDDPKRNHIFDELVKTSGTEFAKTFGRLCSQAVTSVIVPVNDKPVTNQDVGKFAIPADVLTQTVGDLNGSANVVAVAPFYTGNGKAVRTGKVKSLRCTH